MINVRYHIFSLIAVFAALAIGLTIGTTVVRGPLVDNLRQNLDRVEARNETVRTENESLREALQAAHVLDDGGGALLAGRAQGTLVLTVEEQGADGDSVNGIREAFADGGALLLGRVIVDSENSEVGEQLAMALSMVRGIINSANASLPVNVADSLRDVLLGVLAEGSIELRNLREETITVPSNLRVVVIGDRNNGFADWGTLVSGLINGLSTDVISPLPIVAEIDDLDLTQDDELDPSVVAVIREDELLRVAASTVDNASHFVGWAATVLGAENSLSRVAVHLGVHKGSEGLLPANR